MSARVVVAFWTLQLLSRAVVEIICTTVAHGVVTHGVCFYSMVAYILFFALYYFHSLFGFNIIIFKKGHRPLLPVDIRARSTSVEKAF